MGGTHGGKGKDKGFYSQIHLIGQAVKNNDCQIRFMCGKKVANITIAKKRLWFPRIIPNITDSQLLCMTAPHVRCSLDSPWVMLWNLHVHSKQTLEFVTEPCECSKEHFL